MNVKYSIGRWFRKLLLKNSKRQALAWIVKLNRPDLSQQDHAEFFAWLEASADNQLEYLKAERAWEAAGEIKSYQPVGDRRFTPSGWAWSGALTCCFLISFIIFKSFDSEMVPIERFEAAEGYQKIELSDGSHAVLGRGARGSFSRNGDYRLFSLELGRAYFDVKKDKSIPFIVESSLGAVKVHGTKFSVELDSQNAVITVLEGVVEVVKDRHKSGQRLLMNQQYSFADLEDGSPVTLVDAEKSLTWRKLKLVFEGDKLVDAVAKLEEQLDAEIVLDTTVSDITIVGVVSLENRDDAVSTIAEIANLKWRRISDKKFIIYENKN